ncbi:MAG TPA: acylphosphatase, partial [Candidatus Dormibacteraeota bacterium]|nr:acylphosphatase [Candidatus Dormibacteraeota bacterium]
MDAPGTLTERRRVHVHGVVQGVGFRPFVWRLAREHGLAGLVRNTSGAVVIELEGSPDALDRAIAALTREAPALARITAVASERVPALGEAGFRIEESVAVASEYQPIAPDAATCPDCVHELFDPSDRRHRYPFVNCTNCGPRFTIIEDIPYDRPLTTMRRFAMCAPCRREYDDP